MPSSRLKKLILRKERALVTEVLSAIDPGLYIQDINDDALSTQQNGQKPDSARVAILIDGETIGWVMGGDKAATAAKILSRLAQRELEKRELTQELLSKYKEITLLFRLAEQLGNTLDIDAVSQLIMREAEQLLPSDGGMLLLRTTSNEFEHVASFGNSYPSNWSGRCKLKEGLIGTLVASQKTDTIDNILHSPQYAPLVDSDQATCALICVPLKQKERLIGAVILHRTNLRPYRAKDLKLLTTLCAQATSVIGVLSHEKQLKESRQNALIFQLSSQIRQSLDLSDILDTAVQKINAVLQAERCFFLWYRESSLAQKHGQKEAITEANSSFLEVVSEAKDGSLPSILGRYPLTDLNNFSTGKDRHTILELLQAKSSLQVTQASQQAQHPFCNFLYTLVKAQGSEALLAVPVQTQTGQVGLLVCTRTQSQQWAIEETELLQAVSNQLVIAIDQAELYERSCHSRQLAEDKATQLKEAINELQHMQLKLVQTEKMSSLGQMVAGISHEINNPVGFIYGNLAHLRTGIQDILNLLKQYQHSYPNPPETIQQTTREIDVPFLKNDFKKILNSMETGSLRIKEIVLSLQNFSRLDQSEMKCVDLQEGIESALLLVQHRLTLNSQGNAREYPVTVIKEYSALPPIHCQPRQINQVFMSLLSNSLDALEKNSLHSVPQIRISTSVEKNWATIKFADNGAGIPANIQDRLFDPFFTTKEVGEGTGLGLSICYQIIVEQHSGKIACYSEDGHGAEMVVKIPIEREPIEPTQQRMTNHASTM